ncbi:HU family DNA-binding protein [Parabacteroides gordonii]|uniref:HU family DNA-binding protein n=1 Tax=Parabacteroides gordonii TaxID=574930 RepID=UPI0026F21126|nr:HU family DNA-binding protein [Parabacteroides gordonii]
MNKKKLIEVVAAQSGTTQEATRKVINALFSQISECIQSNEAVVLQGTGSFRPWHQCEREGRNPKTGVPTSIPHRLSVKFKPGKFLLEELNK